MSVARCRTEMTRNECLKWIEYLDKDLDNPFRPHTREDYLIAWVVYWIRIVNCGDSKDLPKIKFEDCLMKFGNADESTEETMESVKEMSFEQRRIMAERETQKQRKIINL